MLAQAISKTSPTAPKRTSTAFRTLATINCWSWIEADGKLRIGVRHRRMFLVVLRVQYLHFGLRLLERSPR